MGATPHLDLSPVLVNNVGAEPQPDAGALHLFCREKGVENPLLVLGGNAEAAIANRGAHRRSGAGESDAAS